MEPIVLARELGPAMAALNAVLDETPRIARALPQRATRFLAEWESALERARRATSEGELAASAFVLVDAVPSLDELAFALRRSSWLAGVAPSLREARDVLGRALESTPRIALLPALESSPREVPSLEAQARALGVDPARALEVVTVPSRAAAGTVVALERRGVIEGKTVATKARVHVAIRADERALLLDAGIAALESTSPSEESREDHARLVAEADGALRDDPVANGEAAVRFAVSALERAAVPGAVKAPFLQFLNARGIAPIALEPGERFDPERHPASMFERRLSRAGARGTVVATRLTGFRDAKGVVLARAVVVVAE